MYDLTGDLGITRGEAATMLSMLIGGVVLGAFLLSWMIDLLVEAWRRRRRRLIVEDPDNLTEREARKIARRLWP